MNNIYNEFKKFFDEENKEEAVKFILEKLQMKEIDVIDLYTNILAPSLNELKCKLEDKPIYIWKEHVKTAIVRTIVECSYPYVIDKRNELKYEYAGKVVVLCPPEEYHDIGARMVSDFFTICGCDSIFVGSNTPYADFYNAIDMIRPKFIAISVSNYYNLVVTKKIIQEIKSVANYPLTIIVGGSAFNADDTKYKLIGAHYHSRTFEDILNIVKGEVVL